jgi:hypothetical protein
MATFTVDLHFITYMRLKRVCHEMEKLHRWPYASYYGVDTGETNNIR